MMTNDHESFLSSLQRVPSKSLTDDTVARLRLAIIGGHYAPGEMLPTEAALVGQLGVSRTVLREAISQLKAQGLLMSKRGKGTYIAERSNTLTVSLRPSGSAQNELRHLFAVRAVIEIGVAERAALTWTPPDMMAITAAMAEMKAAIERGENGSYADFAFHCAVAESTHNPYFMDLLNSLRARLSVELRTAWENSRAIGQGPVPAYTEHDTIFRAIAARDAVAARDAARLHLTNAAVRLGLQGLN
jgi:GntR family transcriptional repressor for pyruvate dehydrogenase complex